MKLSKEVKVGLLATVALTIVYVGFNFLKGEEVFSANNSYYTIYNHCKGLSTASPVLLNGMPVGRVKSLQILSDTKHSVLVAFEITKEIRLTDATKTRLVSSSILGGRAIDLLIEEGNPLENYATVPGQVDQDLGDAFVESALPAIQDAKDISMLVGQFVANLNENMGKINNIFSNLENTTQQLRRTITQNQQEFHTLSRNMAEISNMFADREEGVGPLLAKFNQLMETVKSKEARELAENLGRALGSIEKILEDTEQGKNNLGKVLYDDGFYKDLHQTLGNLDKLLMDLKAHPWRYVSFSVFGNGKKGSREEIEVK